MNNIYEFTSDFILKITDPKILFQGKGETENKKIYKKLSLKWHPDKNIGKENTDKVFSHINTLYDKISTISVSKNNLNEITISSTDGKEYNLKYLKKYITEIGINYISHEYVVYFFANSEKDNVLKNIKIIENIQYADEKMKNEFSKYVPKIFKTINTVDGVYLLFKKEKQFINLSDVLNHLKGKISPEHVAWILSSIYNFTCFLHYNKIMHGGILSDHIFIDPETHQIRLIGGWWYAKLSGEKLDFLSKSAFNLASSNMLKDKTAELKLDLSMIKLLGRTLLGDSNGVKLQHDQTIPKPFSNWLLEPDSFDIFSTYSHWINNILHDSFGKRRFVKFDLSYKDLY